MAEEVEISNVGGDGVASEVTLARLTASMELMAAKKGVNPAEITKKMKKVMDESSKHVANNTKTKKENTQATKKATKETNRFAKSLGGLAGGIIGAFSTSIKGFSNALLGTETDLTTFASALPGVGGYLAPFTQYLDDSIDGFRNLSASGASFGNSIENTRRSAASLGLSFEEFQSLVTNNSATLALLGGSVTQGAERFAKMNKNLKTTRDFESLKNMGFTVMEINEGMSDYIALQANMGRLQGRSTQSLAEGSADYLKQIDLLAKVTGKTREEAEAQLASQAQDAGIRAMLDALGEGTEEYKNLQLSLALIDEVGGDAAIALKDLTDGVINNGEVTGKFLAMLGDAGPGVQDALEQIGQGADPQILLTALENSVEGLSGFATGTAAEQKVMIDALRSTQPEMAGFLDSMMQMRKVSQRDIAAARAEQDARDEITDNLTVFDDAIRDIRKVISDAFLSSGVFKNMGEVVGDLAKTFGELVESDSWKETLNNIFAVFNQVIDVIKTFVSDWMSYDFMTALMGGTKEIDNHDVAVPGLLGNFKSLFDEGGPLMNMFTDVMETVKQSIVPAINGVISSAFSSIGTGIKDWFKDSWDTILVGALAGLGVIIAAPFIGAAAVAVAPFVAIFAGIAAMFGWEALKDKAIDGWNAITGVFTGIGDWWSNLDIMSPLTNMWDTVKGWFTFGEGESFSISAVGTKMWESVTGWFSMEGTDFSISALGTVAWESVKGWFNFLDTTFSISTIATDAWNTVTGWFGFGEGEAAFSISQLASDAWTTITDFFSFGDNTGFSITQLASEAWNTVTGWFGFGEGEAAYSISGIASGVWETVKGWFSFDNFEFPSITGLFNNVWEKLTGFFDFDFELPSFKSFLPAWMGGGDESTDITVDARPAADGANALMNAQTAMASFANIEGLENNLNAIKNGLDVSKVRNYTNAMEDLVEVLGRMNEVLAEDNEGTRRNPGTGVAAADLLGQIGSATSGTSQGTQQLNSTMQQVLMVLSEIRDLDQDVERNTRNIIGSNLAYGGVSNVG